MIPGIDSSKRLVYGEGPKTANIMIVGEAPGSMEERTGKPFIGPAGDILTDSLHKVGIPRQTCYITNVIKERPYKNNIKPFLDLSKKYPRVSPAYIKYVEYLKSEIEDVHPNVVVALGGTALWALCEIKGITNYRGSILKSSLIPDLKVIPMLHPASALRKYVNRHLLSFDFGRAKLQSEFPWFDFTEREYIIEPSFDDCMDYLNECSTSKLFAFDIEVYGTEVSCISFSHNKAHAISIPFMDSKGDYFVPPQEAALWRKIAEVLESPNIHHVGQNTTFDSTFLFRKYGICVSNIHDTMVAANILFPDFSKGLGFITTMYTDIPYYKDEGKDAIKGRAVPNRRFWTYNAKDSIVLMEALPKQLAELEKTKNLETYNRQRALIPVLTYMTEKGIRMDTEGMKEKSIESTKQIRSLTEELHDLVGYELNPKSSKQVMDYFYTVLKQKPYLKDGRPTADEGALKRLARKNFREASILLKLRSLNKMDGTYYQMKLDEDNRLRCSMNPGRTSSGRLASSKTIFGTGANMQNQPPAMKTFMLPDEKCIVYNVDLAQAENRIVAYLGPDLTMIDAFEKGKDVHALTASFITPAFGQFMSVDEIKEQDQLLNDTHNNKHAAPIGQGNYSWRFWGKKANHAFNYGQGYRAFSYQVEIPEVQGKKIHAKYHSAYPGVNKMQAWIQNELRSSRTLTNLYDRKRVYLDRWGDQLFLEAYSFIPQSSIADKINLEGLLLMYNNQELFKHVEILNQIHDSIVLQIPISAGWEYHTKVLVALKKSLEKPLTFRGREFIIPVDIEMLVHNFGAGTELSLPNSGVPTYLEQNYQTLFNR